MRYEEEENSNEQDADTNAHESTKTLLEGPRRYELLAGLTGRTAPVPPTQALQTSRTNGARHRTIWRLATAFVHDLTLSEDPLLFKRMVMFLSCSKYSTCKSASNLLALVSIFSNEML